MINAKRQKKDKSSRPPSFTQKKEHGLHAARLGKHYLSEADGRQIIGPKP
jgi:hypothetical protein